MEKHPDPSWTLADACRQVGLGDQAVAIEVLEGELKALGCDLQSTLAFASVPIVMPYVAGRPRNVPGSDFAGAGYSAPRVIAKRPLVRLRVDSASHLIGKSGKQYLVGADRVAEVEEDDAAGFVAAGYERLPSELNTQQKAALLNVLRPQLLDAFRTIMLEGRHGTCGRRASPSAPLDEFPQSAWPFTVEMDLRSSCLKLKLPEGHAEHWCDVRVSPLAQPAAGAVKGDDVVKAARAELQQSDNKPTIRAEKSCREWLAEQMRAAPDARPMRKSDFLTAAQKNFPRLSERSFDRAWGVAIQETGSKWDARGRPKKTPQQNSRTN